MINKTKTLLLLLFLIIGVNVVNAQGIAEFGNLNSSANTNVNPPGTLNIDFSNTVDLNNPQQSNSDWDTDSDGVPDSIQLDAPKNINADASDSGYDPHKDPRNSDADCKPSMANFSDRCDWGYLLAYPDIDSSDFDSDGNLVDMDGDGAPNMIDNDSDGNGIPDRIDVDTDGDGIIDSLDVNPTVPFSGDDQEILDNMPAYFELLFSPQDAADIQNNFDQEDQLAVIRMVMDPFHNIFIPPDAFTSRNLSELQAQLQPGEIIARNINVENQNPGEGPVYSIITLQHAMNFELRQNLGVNNWEYDVSNAPLSARILSPLGNASDNILNLLASLRNPLILAVDGLLPNTTARATRTGLESVAKEIMGYTVNDGSNQDLTDLFTRSAGRDINDPNTIRNIAEDSQSTFIGDNSHDNIGGLSAREAYDAGRGNCKYQACVLAQNLTVAGVQDVSLVFNENHTWVRYRNPNTGELRDIDNNGYQSFVDLPARDVHDYQTIPISNSRQFRNVTRVRQNNGLFRNFFNFSVQTAYAETTSRKVCFNLRFCSYIDSSFSYVFDNEDNLELMILDEDKNVESIISIFKNDSYGKNENIEDWDILNFQGREIEYVEFRYEYSDSETAYTLEAYDEELDVIIYIISDEPIATNEKITKFLEGEHESGSQFNMMYLYIGLGTFLFLLLLFIYFKKSKRPETVPVENKVNNKETKSNI
jgi:hypothetical protein